MVTVEEYLSNVGKEIKLPSGFTFKIRTLSAFDIIEEMRDVPFDASLLEQQMRAKNDSEYNKLIIKALPTLVEKAIIEPAGIKWGQIDGADKDVLVNEILKSLKVNENIASFREEE